MTKKRISADVLDRVPLFRELTDAERRQMAEIATVKQYEPGELIFRQGDEGRELWVVLEGKCEVVRFKDRKHTARHAVLLAMLEPYSHFGEMSFFHPAPHSASVRAQSSVKLLSISRKDFDQLIHNGSFAAYKLAYHSVQGMADRLRRMDQWVADLASQNPPDAKVPEWSSFRDKLFGGWNL